MNSNQANGDLINETVYTVVKAQATDKVINLMRFMSGATVDITKWAENGEKVKLEREGNVNKGFQREIEEMPRFGAGSEFGRIERLEAREARFRPRKIREQPWTLTVKPPSVVSKSAGDVKDKDVRKFTGKKDGGVMDNSSYYVFFQGAQEGVFEALPVNDWINFTPVQRFKALTAEQAEEQFEKRDKIMNFFPLMKGVKKEEGADGNEGIKGIKKERRSFQVSELDEWGGIRDSDLDTSEEEEENVKKQTKKGKGAKNKKQTMKKKKKCSEDDCSEPGEDSDEGDFDQREFDYMSESSSSASEPEDVRVNKELKSVADEEGLRKIAASDDEDSDEEANKDVDGDAVKDADKMDIDGNPIQEKKKKIKKEPTDADGGEISESSAEDSDDSDIDESKPWSQLQQKKSGSKPGSKSSASEQGSAPTSRAQTPVKEVPKSADTDSKSSTIQGIKRKLNDGSVPSSPAQSSSSASNPSTPTQPSSAAASSVSRPVAASLSASGQPPVKKVKSEPSEGLSEESVRRYLTRRPMTVKDLIKKFKKTYTSGSKSDLMNNIASILKKINPDKQQIRGELHLSLKAPK